MVEKSLVFSVPFVAGKERSRVCRNGGKVHQYTPKTTKANMNIIRKSFVEAVQIKNFEIPISAEVTLEIDAFSLLPKSRPKHIKYEVNTFKPDADNIAKLVMDALNGIAYNDDKQVTELYVRKHERQRQDHSNMSEMTKVYIHWIEDE